MASQLLSPVIEQYPREAEFRPVRPEGGDYTLATDIPGNWSLGNVLPGTDPGMAAWHEKLPGLFNALLHGDARARAAARNEIYRQYPMIAPAKDGRLFKPKVTVR